MDAETIKKLRELAEAATPGPWAIQLNDKPGKSLIYRPASADMPVPIHKAVCSAPFLTSGDAWEVNAAFIAAANPAVILSLIDALDTQSSRTEAMRKGLEWVKAFPGDSLVTAKAGSIVYSAWEGLNESYWTDGHHSQKRVVFGAIEAAKAAAQSHFDATLPPINPAASICDAVLDWIVKNELGDGDREYQASEVVEILDSLIEDDSYLEASSSVAADPIDHVLSMMAARGLTNVDLYPVFGGKSRTSEALNRKRPLMVKHIRALVSNFDMSACDLITEYETALTRGTSNDK